MSRLGRVMNWSALLGRMTHEGTESVSWTCCVSACTAKRSGLGPGRRLETVRLAPQKNLLGVICDRRLQGDRPAAQVAFRDRCCQFQGNECPAAVPGLPTWWGIETVPLLSCCAGSGRNHRWILRAELPHGRPRCPKKCLHFC